MLSKNIKIILLLCIIITAVGIGIFYAVRPTKVNVAESSIPEESKLSEDEKTFLATFYSETNPSENKFTDMRITLQNLVSEYDSLDDYTKEKLIEVLFPENKTADTGSIFTKIVYAEEDLYPMFEYDIGIENVFLKSHDPAVASENSEFLTELVSLSYLTFKELGFDVPEFKVEIIATSIEEFIGSYSVMIPDEFAGIVTNAIYRIYIDFNSGPLVLEARLIHELFHAFQEQAMKSHVHGVINDAFINWLKESTAIWAIDQVSPDNNFELEFVESLYKYPIVEYYSLTGYDYYTWYQLFFYFTEILETPNYVSKLFSQYRLYSNADTLFATCHQSRMMLNEDFAKLGMTLFHQDKEYLTFTSVEPLYPHLKMEIHDENRFDLSEIADEANDPWREEIIPKAGFSYRLITIPEEFDGKITFSQSLSMVNEEQMTGMRIAVNRSGNWEWENFTFEPALHVIDIGQSMDIIDSIVIMFFSTGLESPETIKYKITTGESTGSDGTITVKWEKIYASEKDDFFERELVTTIISEELEKQDAGEDTSFYATIKEIAPGDSYRIKNMNINYIYDYLKKEDGVEEKLIGYGTYDHTGDSEPQEIPGLGDLKGSMDDIKDMLEEASENLKDLQDLPGMDEYKEFIPELPDIPDMDLTLPSGGLNRIIIRPELGVFEIHPSLPVDIYNSDWVEYEYTIKTPDPDDSSKTLTETSKYSDRCSEIFPIWFVNPDFTEDFTMEDPEKEFAEIEDTGELMNKIINLQETLNRLNIKKLIDNPGVYYQIDPKEVIDPVPESGTIEEKAMFNDKEFKSEIKASITTEKGNKINLTINMDYTFK